ncbi:zinc-finger domain-containing protein [Kangiella japonica]|uniref:zinc-finger domain-containing protein n=1 Tax=Kangiella japonica TaxID=647384 RepID=UPI0031D6193D
MDNPRVDKDATEKGSEQKEQKAIEITSDDLPLSCPMPDVTLWSQHPRVYIPIKDNQGHCPYCGNKFILKS